MQSYLKPGIGGQCVQEISEQIVDHNAGAMWVCDICMMVKVVVVGGITEEKD